MITQGHSSGGGVRYVRPARSLQHRDGPFRFAFVLLQVAFLGTTILVVPAGVALAANPSADLDQCANQPAPSPVTNGCDPDAWVNGNLGASKSTYREGDSIPYRMRFDNLSLGSHDVIVEWDTTKSGKHAIDYLTTWNRTVADSDPCVGVSGCSSSTTFPIPADPQVTGAGVTPVAGNFTLFGGTVTAVSAYSYPDGSGFSSDKSARLTITFTADVANPVLAWGGHIASRADWGLTNSAVAIPGSPYHMRLIDLDGAGGNQDRSLSEQAVIFPGSITIKKQADPEGSTSFSFTATSSPLSSFNLVDDGTSANTKIFSDITDFQAYAVAESLPNGWQLDNRACQTTSQNGGSTSNSGSFGVSIVLKEGENVTCTFSNSETPNPSLNVTKEAAESSVGAAGDVIHYTIVVHNTGNTALTGVSVNDPLLSDEDCDGVAGAPFVNTGLSIPKGGSLTCTGTYTLTQADIDNNGGGDGDIDNTVTADSNETPPDTASAAVPIVYSPSLNVTKDAAESSVDAAGDVIHYTIVVTNTGNATLTGVSIDDPLLSDEDCDGVAGAPFVKTGFSIPVGGSLTCTGTYTLTQADIDNNGGGDGDIDNTVTADSNETGPDTASAAVPIVYGPALNVLKTVTSVDGDNQAPFLVDAAGDVIDYSITVFNTGNVTLTGVSVNDPLLTNEDCDGVAGAPYVNTGFTINVGGSLSCTGSYTVTQADLDNNGGGDGDIDNVVTADSNETGPDTDDASVPLIQSPSLSITKDATESGFDSVGDVIHYTIVAKNTGNVTLHNADVTDPNAPDLDCTPDVPVAVLAPGAEIHCTASHTIVQADLDAGSFYNQACVDDGQGGAAARCDDVTTPGEQNPSLAITKDATESGFDSVGDVIHYTIEAQNTGNVTLHNVDITDQNAPNLDCTPDVPVADLAPNATITCTASHTINQGDIDTGFFYNQACVDDGQDGAAATCDDVTTPGSKNPHLSITKVPTEPGFSKIGDVIHYTVTATNDGNVTLHNVDVADPNAPDLDCAPVTPVTDLAPSEQIVCTASHTITQGDIDAGSFFNEACVDDGPGNAAKACDHVTTEGEQNPDLSITKQATEQSFDSVGDVIHYTIVATNTGNVTLHGVDVTDPNAPDLDCTPVTPVTDLAPGDSITCTASHTITQDDLDAGHFFNEACADDAEGPAEKVCANVDTQGEQNPALAIDKVVTETQYTKVGQVLHYTITVTNVGEVTLHDVIVTDPQVNDLECTPALPVPSLAVGASFTCTATHTIVQADLDTGFFTNVACADDEEGAPETGANPVCDEVTNFGQEVEEKTNPPTLPNTAAGDLGGPSRPSDGSWLLILALATLLASVVLATPRRRRQPR